MRLRTINRAYAWLCEADANTCISANHFRILVTNGRIPSLKSGNRFLVDIDTLQDDITAILKGDEDEF